MLREPLGGKPPFNQKSLYVLVPQAKAIGFIPCHPSDVIVRVIVSLTRKDLGAGREEKETCLSANTLPRTTIVDNLTNGRERFPQ
jgi:hypothetical protein